MHFVDLHFSAQVFYFYKIPPTRKKKYQHEGHLKQLNETLNEFAIGFISATNAIWNETLISQTNSLSNDSDGIAVG